MTTTFDGVAVRTGPPWPLEPGPGRIGSWPLTRLIETIATTIRPSSERNGAR
jgi:hypothetical protein